MNRIYYKEYYNIERNHWWFKARKEIIKELLKKFIVSKEKESARILNVGAATGATSQMLDEFGTVTSVEFDEDCCEFLETNLNIHAINASLTDLPFEDEQFDIVCVFDVIEHIKDDLTAASEIRRILKRNGHYFITVPAYNFLWSKHDDINHHIRRYTNNSLNEVLGKSGLLTEYSSYFNFWLFMPIAILRMIQKVISAPNKQDESSGSDFEILNSSKIIDNVFYSIFGSEIYFLKKKIYLPFGISLLNIGKKCR